MTISRDTAKRQIAAARALLTWLERFELEDDQYRLLLARLEVTTEALALEAHTPDQSQSHPSR